MNPKAVSKGSQAQIEYALADAKTDIEALRMALHSVLASCGDQNHDQ